MKYIFAFLLVCLSSIAIAQDAPIEITADNTLEWDRDASTFIARGNALATQGKTSLNAETLTANYTEKAEGISIQTIIAHGGNPTVKTEKETLTANQITAHFSKDDKTQLQSMTAKGNVKIETTGKTLYGDNAEYSPLNDKAIVTGNVKIIDGKNTLTGDRAEFNTKTNTSTLKSNKAGGRVKAVFFPGGAK